MRRRLWGIIAHQDYDPVALLLATLLIGMGIWMLCPAWNTFGSMSALLILVGRVPEELVGALCIVLGLIEIWCLTDGALVMIKTFVNLIIASLMTVFAIMFIVYALPALGTIVYAMMAVASIWVYGRTRIDSQQDQRVRQVRMFPR
jgi:hypothetical protein